MPPLVSEPAIVLFCRLLISCTMLAAGLAKLKGRVQFRGYLIREAGLSEALAGFAARTIPLTESALGVAMFLGILPLKASLLTFGLLAFFSGFLLWTLRAGKRETDCFCFGAEGRQESIAFLLGRNLVLLVMALSLYSAPARRGGALPDHPHLRPIGLAPAMTATRSSPLPISLTVRMSTLSLGKVSCGSTISSRSPLANPST